MKRTRKYERVIWEQRGGGSAVFCGRASSISRTPREKRRHRYEDVDNLVYDISFRSLSFFLKYMCIEGVRQRVFTT